MQSAPLRSVSTRSPADDNGVAGSNFYWHSPDWRYGTWDLIGSDTTVLDGWKVRFDPAGRTIPGSALVARAYDPFRAGSAAVIWNLQFDTIAPVTALQPLPGTPQSTIITLNWSGSDRRHRSEPLRAPIPGQWWSLDVCGKLPCQGRRRDRLQAWADIPIDFRMRGVDNAGNAGELSGFGRSHDHVAATCTPDAFDAAQPDDNTSSNAVQLTLKTAQEHNFCPANDQDWTKFTAQAGTVYRVQVNSLSGGAAAIVSVTDPNGGKVLAQSRSSGWASRPLSNSSPRPMVSTKFRCG